MSRTFRRKKSWAAHYYIDDWVNDEESLNILRGIHNYYPGCGHPMTGKYTGYSKEKIFYKLFYKYHTDGWYKNYTLGFKKQCKEKLRASNKVELINYLKGTDDEDYNFSTRREIRGKLWWYEYG
jgi:hypothetical protein